MSLQRRLTLFFILIVVLPLLAAGVVVKNAVVGEISRRAELGLRPSLQAVLLRHNERVEVLDDLTRAAVGGSVRFARALRRGERGLIGRLLGQRLERLEGMDFLVTSDRRGRLAGAALGPADFAPGFERPAPGELLQGGPTGPGWVRTPPMPVRDPGGRRLGTVVGGFWLDREFLRGADLGDVEVFVFSSGRLVAGTRSFASPIRVRLPGSAGPLDLGEPGRAVVAALGPQTALVAWTPEAPVRSVSGEVVTSMLGLLAAAVALTAGLAYLLARLITRPLEELNEGARAIAAGRFGHRIPVRSRDEVGQLATAFNEMSAQLEHTIGDLERSRDSLQRAIERVGATLRSTHDMSQILDSILGTAADAVSAEVAALWVFSPARDELFPALARGVATDDLARARVGRGIIGMVAERGITVRLPSADGPRPGRTDPPYPVVVATPLHSSDRIMGVLAVYRSDPARPFEQSDVDTVVFLAEQGGVAVENVLLHEEAQRLSLTDQLTGAWNRRYLHMQFKQVAAAAARFDRPFSVLILDLDHFKTINDTYGHQLGDAILVELTRRVKSNLREIDTFARYGGEEFVCLLAETDLSGAKTTAEKIRRTVEGEPFKIVGHEPLSITVSVGVATYPQHGMKFGTLLKAADEALYAAKQEGRNRVCVAGSPPGGLQLAT